MVRQGGVRPLRRAGASLAAASGYFAPCAGRVFRALRGATGGAVSGLHDFLENLVKNFVKIHKSANIRGKIQDKVVDGTKGGVNTKVHATVYGLGNPVELLFSAGNAHDC